MKILVGWWNPRNGRLVNIPSFDSVTDTDGWLPAVVDVPATQVNNLLKTLAAQEPE